MCTEPFVKELKKKGYFLVSYPKTTIKPLHIYQSMRENKFMRLFAGTELKPMSGFLKEMFNKPEGGIGLSKGTGIGIDMFETQKINSEASLEVLLKYFNTLLPKAQMQLENQQIKALFKNTQTVVFKIEKIETFDTNEIDLRNWLNNNQSRLNVIYNEDIDKGTLYIATSLLKAKKITLTLERGATADAAADFANLLNLPITGKLKMLNENSNSDKLLYSNEEEGIIIGIRLVKLKYSEKGILTFDNKQDYKKVLNAEDMKIEPDYFISEDDFVDIG